MKRTLRDRIEEISKLIFEVAQGNFDYKIPGSHHNDTDELQAIIVGINMLGQELKKSTVSRDYMKRIYDGVVDILIITDGDFKIKTINKTTLELLGYSEENVSGVGLSELFEESTKESAILDKIIDELNSKSFSKNKELCFISKSGKEIPVSCSFSVLQTDNEREILLTAKDISDLKANEKALRAARDQSEEANRSKGRFLSNMSHEIRTPLNGIIGFSEILRNTTTTKVQEEYISMIYSSGKSLGKLLNDVLDLNKIDLDKLKIEKVPFDFRNDVKSNLYPYKYLAREKKLKFNLKIDKSVPQTVIGDPTRINQIIVNFISNSIKFTDEGSIQLNFKAFQRNDSLWLYGELEDTGIGVKKRQQSSIFEAFIQSDSSTTRKHGGSGLGLAICKELVGLMHGQIGVESPLKDGRGSRFWFTIPIVATASVKLVKEPDVELDFKLKNGNSILVVDDNHVNLLLLKKMLISAGGNVVSAVHGVDAVEKAREDQFDLILMDIQMPVMDGFDATVKLRQLGYKKPILALSANVDKENIEKCMTVGMNDYLQKPFQKRQLFGLLEKWMSE